MSRETERFSTSALLLLAALSFFWGVSWPIIKIALAEVPVWTFRTICLVCGGLGLLGLARINRLPLRIPRAELGPLLLCTALNVVGWHIFSAYGILHMQAGRASIIGYTMPVWAALLSAIVLKERLGWKKILALLFGMAGLAALIGPHLASVGAAPLGALFMLGAALCWGAGTVLVKYFHWTMPTTSLTAWQVALGSIPIIVGAWVLEPTSSVLRLSPLVVCAMVYIVLFPTAFCYWAWFRIVSILPAALAAICTLSIPVIGVFSSAVMLGERVGLQELIALCLVLAAMALVLIQPRRAAKG